MRCKSLYFLGGAVVLLFSWHSAFAPMELSSACASDRIEVDKPQAGESATSDSQVDEAERKHGGPAQPRAGSGGLVKLADGDAATEAKLDQYIQFDSDGTPVVDVINYVAKKIDADVVIVRPFDADTAPMTLHARSISARTALELALEEASPLEPYKYDYVVRDGAMLILPLDRAMH